MRRLRDRGGLDGTRYSMHEKLLSIGDDSWIETEGGERAFKVDGKALRVRSTFILESPAGEEGYPGTLQVQVDYTLTPPGGLRIEYTATWVIVSM